MSSPAPETPPGTNSTAASPPSPSAASPPSPVASTPTTNVTASPPSPALVSTAPTSVNSTPFMPLTPADSGGLAKGTLTGIIIGAVLGSTAMLIIGGIFVFFYRRAKRKRNQGFEKSNYYGALPQPKVDQGSGLPQQWQSTPSPSTDGKGGLPPKPPGVVANHQKSSSAGSLPTYSSATSSGIGSERPYMSQSSGMSLSLSQSTFTYDELAMATEGFSGSNLLGQGGFGYVHKGVLPNGKTVAVKQLKSESKQGEREFHAEVEVISRVHHRHLVSLVGYCVSGGQRMLVYEFVPNKTLEFHLHAKDRPTMDWSTRMKIAVGAAKGLAYLHEDCHPKIIHRDIKASNILIDDSFEAKVADFGLAKFSTDTDTHVSTRVMGTFGYLAPEYAASGKLTEKSDVFSYGVVLLELITGRKPVDKTESFTDDSMVEWARPLLSQALEIGNFSGLLDPRLQTNYDREELTRMTACAATCVRHSARRRPRMSQVVRALEGNISLEDLYEGGTPGHSRVFGSFESLNYDAGQYNEDLKKFRKLALESQEHGTSEYSGPSSEYGQHPSASTSSGLQNTQETERI